MLTILILIEGTNSLSPAEETELQPGHDGELLSGDGVHRPEQMSQPPVPTPRTLAVSPVLPSG